MKLWGAFIREGFYGDFYAGSTPSGLSTVYQQPLFTDVGHDLKIAHGSQWSPVLLPLTYNEPLPLAEILGQGPPIYKVIILQSSKRGDFKE